MRSLSLALALCLLALPAHGTSDDMEAVAAPSATRDPAALALDWLVQRAAQDGLVEGRRPAPSPFESPSVQWRPGGRNERPPRDLRDLLERDQAWPESAYANEPWLDPSAPLPPALCGYGVRREVVIEAAYRDDLEVGMIEIVEDILAGAGARPGPLAAPLPLAIVEYVGHGEPDLAGQHIVIADAARRDQPSYRTLVSSLLGPERVHYADLSIVVEHEVPRRSFTRARFDLPALFGVEQVELTLETPYRGRGLGGLVDFLAIDHGSADPHTQDEALALINLGALQLSRSHGTLHFDGEEQELLQVFGDDLAGPLSQTVTLLREVGWARSLPDSPTLESSWGPGWSWTVGLSRFSLADPIGLCTLEGTTSLPGVIRHLRWRSQGGQFQGGMRFAPHLPMAGRPLAEPVRGAFEMSSEGVSDWRGRPDNRGTVMLRGHYAVETEAVLLADPSGGPAHRALLSTLRIEPWRPDPKVSLIRDVIVRTLTLATGEQAVHTSVVPRERHRSEVAD